MNSKFTMIFSAATALFLTACSGGGNDGPDTPGPQVPQSKNEAVIPFITTMSDAPLTGSDEDYNAISRYVGDRKASGLMFIDRADNAGLVNVQKLVTANRGIWSAFAVSKANPSAFEGGFFIFNAPTRFVRTHTEGDCNMTGVSVSLAGNIYKADASGNLVPTKDVKIPACVYTARFETEAQVNDFGKASGIFDAVKAENKNFLAVGLVKNDLFQKLQAAVAARDSQYKVVEVSKGASYTIYLMASEKNWGLNGVEKKTIAGNIESYEVSVKW